MNTLLNAIKYGVRQLVSRPLYILVMIGVPVAFSLFYLSLMDNGLPLQTPVAVVDLDNTELSRKVIRNLGAGELVSINYKVDSYEEAMSLVKANKVYGFFMIPRNFQRDAESRRETCITYYCNMAYFIPGTLSFKGFKQTAVTTSGGIAMTTLVGAGVNQSLVETMLQPVTVQDHPLGNPWLNYAIYLGNFLPCLLQLIIFQVTAFALLDEIKRGTSPAWLRSGGGSIVIAAAGKLMPQFVIFSVVGLFMQSLMYGYNHFPLNGSVWAMIASMLLLVAASQAMALTICCITPNLRIALSLLSLTGILSFSIAGFSFPVEDMYPSIGILSFLLPIRYYFLIAVNVALNGYDIYYCRWDFICLILFMIVPFTALWKLKRYSSRPVYVP